MSAADDLAAARAARTAILTGRVQRYQRTIGGQVEYLDLAELNRLIDQLEGEVAIQAIGGEGGPTRIEVGLGSMDPAV